MYACLISFSSFLIEYEWRHSLFIIFKRLHMSHSFHQPIGIILSHLLQQKIFYISDKYLPLTNVVLWGLVPRIMQTT